MNFDPAVLEILKRYSDGEVTCERAAYEIWELKIPSMPDPSASEVIVWSKMAGFGIPNPPDELVEREVRRARDMLGHRGGDN